MRVLLGGERPIWLMETLTEPFVRGGDGWKSVMWPLNPHTEPELIGTIKTRTWTFEEQIVPHPKDDFSILSAVTLTVSFCSESFLIYFMFHTCSLIEVRSRSMSLPCVCAISCLLVSSVYSLEKTFCELFECVLLRPLDCVFAVWLLICDPRSQKPSLVGTEPVQETRLGFFTSCKL